MCLLAFSLRDNLSCAHFCPYTLFCGIGTSEYRTVIFTAYRRVMRT